MKLREEWKRSQYDIKRTIFELKIRSSEYNEWVRNHDSECMKQRAKKVSLILGLINLSVGRPTVKKGINLETLKFTITSSLSKKSYYSF